jgi:peroxiredoxin
MPNVKAAYEKFGAKGFGIVGVSLDRDEESWKKGVSDLGMAWPQISDLKYWDCEGAALYGVRAIPATVLINQEGTILARNLRGDALAEKLEEVLK